MAVRPGAARSAGRALLLCPVTSRLPWHRVTASDGSLSKDAERAALQLRRLRREGSRPRSNESVRQWAARVGAPLVGRLPERWFAPSDAPEIDRWGALRVEPLAGEAEARARGFRPVDEPAVASTPPPPGPAPKKPDRALTERLQTLPWSRGVEELERSGRTVFRGALARWDVHRLLVQGQDSKRFERTIDMAPRGYGVGRYHYWKEPGPEAVRALRAALWRELREPAARVYGMELPKTLAEFQRRCRAADQRRGSSILLHYGPGGINHAHRDVYGSVWFPYQALVVLSERGTHFEGGDFVLYDEREQGPDERHEIAASMGDLVVFASSWRREGRKRVPLRHGMNPITRGHRSALGVILNLAE